MKEKFQRRYKYFCMFCKRRFVSINDMRNHKCDINNIDFKRTPFHHLRFYRKMKKGSASIVFIIVLLIAIILILLLGFGFLNVSWVWK